MFKKILKKTLEIIPFVFLTLAVILILQIVISIRQEKTPTIFGYGLFLVVSPSMEDVIMTGDLILVNTRETVFDEQDIITFYKSSTPGSEIITHKIESIKTIDGVRYYTTKGVNNHTSNDWEIDFPEDRIIGKYVAKSGFLGDIYRMIFGGQLNFIYAIVILVFMMIAIMEIVNITKEVALHKQELLLKTQEELVEAELQRLRDEEEAQKKQ